MVHELKLKLQVSFVSYFNHCGSHSFWLNLAFIVSCLVYIWLGCHVFSWMWRQFWWWCLYSITPLGCWNW
jgi:hypothetical protein